MEKPTSNRPLFRGLPIGVLTLGLLLLLSSASVSADDRETGKTFNAPGAIIYYEVRGGGSATPLFVVNGGPGFDHSYLHCSDAWDRLAKDRPVVFYDQRGNGRSGPLKAGQSCTLADQIADLEALRAHLGFQQVDMLGHSWGGYLSMAYAARHPEHIKNLIICDSAAPRWQDTIFLFKDVFPETVARQDALAFAESLGDEEASRASIREYLSMLFVSAEKRDAFLAKASSYAYNRGVNRVLNQDIQKYDLNPELPKFKFPTLVITGRYDINVAPAVAYRIHRAIPNSQFVVFERSGHLPFYEEPDAFVRLVEEFLSKN
jgi:proline iminopeptidase